MIDQGPEGQQKEGTDKCMVKQEKEKPKTRSAVRMKT